MNSLILGTFFLILHWTTSYAQETNSLTIITEEWPPFNYTENLKVTGYSTEIIELVMKELKIEKTITVLPSMRARKVLDTSSRTLFYSFIRTPEREKLFKWIGPIGKESIYFYKNKGSKLEIKTLSDAKKVKSICARNDGLVYDLLVKAGFKNIDPSVSAESIYLKTIMGRCDLGISETPIGLIYWLKKMNRPLDSLEQTPLSIIDSSLYMATTLDMPDQEIERWQKALEKVLKSDAFKLIQKKYRQFRP